MSANEIPDELWRKILEIGVKSSTFSFKDLCCISITSRRLCGLSSDDSLWLLLLFIDFPNHNDSSASSSSSSSSSQSPTKFIYRSRFEKEKERKLAAHRRAVLRKESEISELRRRMHELEIRFIEEEKRFQAASLEISNLQRIRQASVALKVWQSEVVRGSHKQMVEQNAVSVQGRYCAVEMEMKLCKQQFMGVRGARWEVRRKLDKARKELESMKYHPLQDYKSIRSGDEVNNAKRKKSNTSIIGGHQQEQELNIYMRRNQTKRLFLFMNCCPFRRNPTKAEFYANRNKTDGYLSCI